MKTMGPLTTGRVRSSWREWCDGDIQHPRPVVNQDISNQLTVEATGATRFKEIASMASIYIPQTSPPEPPVVGQIWPLGLV